MKSRGKRSLKYAWFQPKSFCKSLVQFFVIDIEELFTNEVCPPPKKTYNCARRGLSLLGAGTHQFSGHKLLYNLYTYNSVSADERMNAHGISPKFMAITSADRYACSCLPTSKDVKPRQKILLLQGPVGPFFAELQIALDAAGFAVKRVLFNSGDKLFDHGRNSVRFTGILGSGPIKLLAGSTTH